MTVKITNQRYFCPLINRIFKEPVMAEDGVIYERKAIKSIFKTSNSPFINSPIKRDWFIGKKLLSMDRLRFEIEDYLLLYPEARQLQYRDETIYVVEDYQEPENLEFDLDDSESDISDIADLSSGYEFYESEDESLIKSDIYDEDVFILNSSIEFDDGADFSNDSDRSSYSEDIYSEESNIDNLSLRNIEIGPLCGIDYLCKNFIENIDYIFKDNEQLTYYDQSNFNFISDFFEDRISRPFYKSTSCFF